MLEYDTALQLLNSYGFTSTTMPPYIFVQGDSIGLCYSYDDLNYGNLERISFFDDVISFETFLRKLKWLETNGKKYNVRMVLDNYEILNPKVIFLRNEKAMVEEEIANVEEYDAREKQKDSMDEVSKVILEAGNLLLFYEETKNRQMLYMRELSVLRNVLRQKYYDLQKQVDKYNDINTQRTLNLINEDTLVTGVNEVMEIAAKERYNQYINNLPSLEDAQNLVKEVWDLNMSLELNSNYYEAQVEDHDVRNELRIVESKLALMNELNTNKKSIFKKDLIKAFRKINDQCNSSSVVLSSNYVTDKLSQVNKKYSYFNSLDIFSLCDYLKEALINTNYDDVMRRYRVLDRELINKRLPLNEVASDLTMQYRTKLSLEEQAVLVLYNSKYRKLFDLILDIQDFDKKETSEIISVISEVKGFSKIKTECYDNMKRVLENPINEKIKQQVFVNINFDTFELFIFSIVNELTKIKNIDSKMSLNSDLNMYFHIKDINKMDDSYFVLVTDDLLSLKEQVKDRDELIAVTLLKKSVPVLYSPYYLDFGEVYNKKEDIVLSIKEMKKFEILIDYSDVVVTKDDVILPVVDYVSFCIIQDNITIVNDLKMKSFNTYTKMVLTSKEQSQQSVDN